MRPPPVVVETLRHSPVDALEIHTGACPGGALGESMADLWLGRDGLPGIKEWARSLQLVAVSFPEQPDTPAFLAKVSALLMGEEGAGKGGGSRGVELKVQHLRM